MTHPAPPRQADTNVLVRYLTGEPQDQHARAAALIDGDQPIRVSVVTLLETAHVLTGVYGVPRAQVVDVLTDLLRRQNLDICELPRQRVLDALALCRPSRGVSFGDALIWARAAEDGVEVVTFDRQFPGQAITCTIL